MDPRRAGAAGYAEFRPVADNATPEDRAKSRRIAIIILADELIGAGSVPRLRTNATAHRSVVATEPDKSAPEAN